jgi:hypothetical protein
MPARSVVSGMRLLPAQLDLQIVDHTLYAGNASAEAYRISQIPVIENDSVQRGNAVGDGDEHALIQWLCISQNTLVATQFEMSTSLLPLVRALRHLPR